MSRYVMKFTKNGYVKYTSHLDILRIFKRAFRKIDIHLKYSQGFNPHPKMSFAQPLSLGYSSQCEWIEFETEKPIDAKLILEKMQAVMPDGLDPVCCILFESSVKSLAAEAESAEYKVCIPYADPVEEKDLECWIRSYLERSSIIAMKRQKKTKLLAPVDIRNQIRYLKGWMEKDTIILSMVLDCGSTSNLSPELVITTFLEHIGAEIPRYLIEVERTEIIFSRNLQL